MRISRMTALGAGAALVLALGACAGEGAGSGGGDTDVDTDTGTGTDTDTDADAEDPGDLTAGVAMPTQTYERWINDANNVQEGLEEAGYNVDLQFANDDIPTQQQQLDTMIGNEVDVLIVASIDGTALTGQLQAAADAGIPVIAYDRLLTESPNVDFYVTFDNYSVGVAQANSILHGLGLVDDDLEPVDDAPEGPFNIELFAGSPDDNNSHFFFDGAMDTLEPYFDDGTLEVPSGQTDFGQVAIQRWEQETAQERMENLLTTHYSGDDELHAVLAPADPLSRGIITALRNDGWGPTIDEGMPIVSGQDAEIASVSLIDQGIQYSTIFKDTRLLADQAVAAAQAFLEGSEPEANDTETYDNGQKVVPSYLLDVEMVLQDNITEALVDTGYYTQEQVDSGQA